LPDAQDAFIHIANDIGFPSDNPHIPQLAENNATRVMDVAGVRLSYDEYRANLLKGEISPGP